MVESVIHLLIYVAVVACLYFLIVWFLRSVFGLELPARVVQIAGVILILIVLLLIWRMIGHDIGLTPRRL